LGGSLGKGKLILPFSAKCPWISAPRSPTRWLYQLKPGGEQKSTDVQQKAVTLIYLDPFVGSSLLNKNIFNNLYFSINN
jgi:hypothetical protein